MICPTAPRLTVAVRRGPRLVPIEDPHAEGVIDGPRWHPVDAARRDACFDFLTSHGLGVGGPLSLGRYLDLKADPAGAELIVDTTTTGDRHRIEAAETDFVSQGLAVPLFPYQQMGADFLCALATRDVGALLADQMGLGKTAQAIALLLDQRELGPSLVVAPASLLANWRRELALFAPSLDVMEHAGVLRTGIASGLSGREVVLTSYDTLANDLSFMGDIRWNIVVLDEAQAIRNPDARRAAAVKALDRRVSVAITGTPVENRLMDLWSIAEYVVPALLGSRTGFELVFPDDIERARALGEVVAPVTLRRLVDEVADDLPELLQQEVAFDLTREDAARYTQLAAASSSPLAATTALRVLCAHADEFGWDRTVAPPPKVDHALRLITEAFEENQKLLLFASFQTSLDRLYAASLNRHPEAFLGILDGRVDSGDRQLVIDKFMEFPGPGALFMNPRAAGVGLNITAANHVIHFNPEWNPALTSQATARAYRRKQNLPVTVHHLFYEGTVEEDALQRALWKQELADGVDQGVGTREERDRV